MHCTVTPGERILHIIEPLDVVTDDDELICVCVNKCTAGVLQVPLVFTRNKIFHAFRECIVN